MKENKYKNEYTKSKCVWGWTLKAQEVYLQRTKHHKGKKGSKWQLWKKPYSHIQKPGTPLHNYQIDTLLRLKAKERKIKKNEKEIIIRRGVNLQKVLRTN